MLLHRYMAAVKFSARPAEASASQGCSERPFWSLAGAAWRQVAGGFETSGFSFEWHEWDAKQALDWAHSFHPNSVEICLNLRGSAWVAANGLRMDLATDTVGFFAINGARPAAERKAGERHEFLSVEYDIGFLRKRLETQPVQLHPIIGSCLRGKPAQTAVSEVSALTHRHRDLLKSLLRPPVLASAQRLWYELKALEFATEFFFTAAAGETVCTRAQRLAAERVARAKAILLENLAEPLSLEELGRRVACSPFYLSRTFTQETGLTISQWLRRARLERAAELLRQGSCNVTEAAMEVGYSSLSHFSGAFHEMFGCCPGLYPLRTPAQQLGRTAEGGSGGFVE
jgi:AraC-like DNA-binding protein